MKIDLDNLKHWRFDETTPAGGRKYIHNERKVMIILYSGAKTLHFRLFRNWPEGQHEYPCFAEVEINKTFNR